MTNIINKIMNIFRKKDEIKDYPKNTYWMFDEYFNPNWKEIKKCKPFHDMIGCKQSKQYHREGDVWEHTKLVVKAMREYVMNNCVIDDYNERERARILMTAALFHDLGKPSTTYFDKADNEWHCKDHGLAGSKMARNLLMDESIKFREEIVWLVRNHMVFHYFDMKSPTEKNAIIDKLSKGLSTIENLLALNIADSQGSINNEDSTESLQNRVATIKGIAKDRFSTYKTGSIETRRPCAYIMIGLAGAGKDTFIKRHLLEPVCICRDYYRELLVDKEIKGRKLLLDKAGEGKVTRMVEEAIKDNCMNNRNIVINQTSLTKKGRMELRDKILSYGPDYNIVYVYIEANGGYETCIERRKGQIKPEVIEGMWNKLDFPDYTECDDLIICRS